MFGRRSREDLSWLTARPIAHRGLHDLRLGRPENSRAAFAAAAGADYAIECDLHVAADGVPVVFHDDDLQRLTGENGGVRDRTSRELAPLRLAGTEEPIPTLDELLVAVDGRVPLVIEIKHVPGRDAGLARAVADRLRGYAGRAAVMSFEPALVAEFAALAPDRPVGLTADGDWRSAGAHLSVLRQVRVNFVSYGVHDLPTPLPVLANRVFGLPLISWTIRNPADLAKARRWTDQITFEGFLP